MIDYWPINDQDLRDYVNGNKMVKCTYAVFTKDRFNRSNSALYLNNGYCQVSPGVYFNGSDFTVTAWIKPIQSGIWSRLIDFGNGPNTDNVFVAYIRGQLLTPFVSIYQSSAVTSSCSSSNKLNVNEWSHVSFVLNSTHLSIYINGTLENAALAQSRPRNVNRTLSFIGKSNWPSDTNSNAVFDDIKIYNRALSQDEIKTDMNFIF